MNKENNNISFAFFGTPKIATTVLNKLEESGLLPTVVVTNPDTPKGRGQEIQPPAAKQWAQGHDISVLQPTDIDKYFMNTLADVDDFDVFVVVAYGKILPKALIDIPRRGTVNMHPSLLPKERGAAPVRGAILHEDKTGVSIMKLDEQLDHGPIIAQKQVAEWSKESGGPPKAAVLQERLAKVGGELVAQVLPRWAGNEIEATPQNHKQATYTGKFEKSDAKIDFDDDPYTNFRKIQAFHEWPRPHFFTEDGTRIIINDASLKDGELDIYTVTPAGEEKMDWSTFVKKYK